LKPRAVASSSKVMCLRPSTRRAAAAFTPAARTPSILAAKSSHVWYKSNPDTWLLSVFYMVCTATRLARFNVQTRVVDSRYFVGLPSPWAALTICALLWFSLDATGDLRVILEAVMGAALLLVGTLMVSTFRYNSFKKLDLRKRWSYRALVPIAVVVLLFGYQPRALLLALALLYTLSAPASAAFSRLRPRRGRRSEDAPPPPLEGAP